MISKIINTLYFLDSNIVQSFIRNTTQDDLVDLLSFTDQNLKYRIYTECTTRLIAELINQINHVNGESEPANLSNTIKGLEAILIKVSGKSANELVDMHNNPANWLNKEEKIRLYQQELSDLQPQIKIANATMVEQQAALKITKENFKKELKIAERNGTEDEFWNNFLKDP